MDLQADQKGSKEVSPCKATPLHKHISGSHTIRNACFTSKAFNYYFFRVFCVFLIDAIRLTQGMAKPGLLQFGFATQQHRPTFPLPPYRACCRSRKNSS